MFNDLWLNLLSEAIGIAVTIIIIDRLLESRERRRWNPPTSLVYVRLFNVLDDFLTEFQIRSMDSKKGSKVFIYGKVIATSDSSYKGVDFDKLHKVLKDRFALSKYVNEEIYPTSNLTDLKNQIDTILNSSIPLIDPDFLELLFVLDNSIMTFRRIFPVLPQTDDIKILEDYSFLLSEVILKAVNIRLYLESKADKILPIEDYIDNVVSQVAYKR